MIRQCAGSSVARRLRVTQPRRARWDASRRNGSRHLQTSLLFPTCPASGLTLCTAVPHPEVSCSPCGGLTPESMSGTIPLGGRRPCTRAIHWPDKEERAERVAGTASHGVSKRPIWVDQG